MRRTLHLLGLALFLAPTAHALQLRWNTGTTDLTASQATQAVLVAQAESAEATLPDTWTFQWTADSLGLQCSAFDPDLNRAGIPGGSIP